jgi:hypothetical protein
MCLGELKGAECRGFLSSEVSNKKPFKLGQTDDFVKA